MRRRGSQLEVEVDTIDVVFVEDEPEDEFLALLHEIALEAIALRAGSPGDPHVEMELPPPDPDDERVSARLVRRFGRRRLVRWAVIAVVAVVAAVIAPTVVEARREAARLAALADDPRVLAPLAGPPTEQWRTPGRLSVDALGDAAGAGRWVLPGGAVATWSWSEDGQSGRGRVTRVDGGYLFGLPGFPLVPTVTDGSDAGTLVVMSADGERLRGLDQRLGRGRWSRSYDAAASGPAREVRAVGLVDHVLVLDAGSAVTALDVRDGTLLWWVPVDPGVAHPALTDGEVILLPERGDGTLVARRVADGTEVWRTALPEGTVALAVVDRALVASTGEDLVGLG